MVCISAAHKLEVEPRVEEEIYKMQIYKARSIVFYLRL